MGGVCLLLATSGEVVLMYSCSRNRHKDRCLKINLCRPLKGARLSHCCLKLDGVSRWAELRFGAHPVESADSSSHFKTKTNRHLTVLSALAVEDRLKPETFTSFTLLTGAVTGMRKIR